MKAKAQTIEARMAALQSILDRAPRPTFKGELRNPPASPVPWSCRAGNATATVVARTAHAAREEAMVLLGCEPWELAVGLCA